MDLTFYGAAGEASVIPQTGYSGGYSRKGQGCGLPVILVEYSDQGAQVHEVTSPRHEAARRHPLVTAAVEIFQAEIAEIVAIEHDAGAKEESD